ncbi:uncharacterized protein LOC144866006 [Branchiostoma floridae x Branchiostoma japonicum]
MVLIDDTPSTSLRQLDKLEMGHVGCIPIDLVCDGMIDFALPGIYDETDCAQGLEFMCHGVYGWKCPGENTCLPEAFVCDTIPQCANGEDEKNCDAHCESIGGWRCQCDQLTACYLPEEICDGRQTCYMFTTRTHDLTEDQQCADDEANCEEKCNSTDGFYCSNYGQCIEQDRVCDGVPDCQFSDFVIYSRPGDELNCGTCTGVWASMASFLTMYLAILEDNYPHANEVGVYDYTCSNGQCTSTFFFCDDEHGFECGNWEDEQGCETVRCLGRKCEETHKCVKVYLDTCDGVPNCLDFTEEKNCESTICRDTMLEYGSFKEVSMAQYCDGEEDCRTGADESPRKCAMFTDRLPCIQSNRFISRNNVCDGIPDCVDASDEDACIGRGACLLPVSLLQVRYSIQEGIGTSTPIDSSHDLTLTQWTVEGLDDWLQITLEHPVQLTGVVVSASRPWDALTFSLKYGFWSHCLTAHTEGNEVKVFESKI